MRFLGAIEQLKGLDLDMDEGDIVLLQQPLEMPMPTREGLKHLMPLALVRNDSGLTANGQGPDCPAGIFFPVSTSRLTLPSSMMFRYLRD